MSAAFFFGVLGPLSVLQDGESVSVGGPKERAVLATLLARANHLVTVDMLVEAVWGDHPPRSAERTLQAYVARIRGVLEPERSPGTGSTILVKEGSGYRLRLETEQLDALRFEELARRGSQQL
ncbi:MAG: winged helix-turn-helix domain-containing protein, partial [Acidimicrobiia bacterium]|nr:winged helix-turn-helix domain-containing protein [Acidimicrobiia bacterium]